MDVAAFRTLLTPSGQEVLQTAEQLGAREEDFLRHFDWLRRKVPAEVARAALEMALLRRSAAPKFTSANQLYFTREALEQASPEAVSVYRSERYRPFDFIADLGCSVGCDTLALARFAPTLGIDLDPLRLLMAQANAKGLAGRAAFLQADLAAPLPLSPASDRSALFFDPARRAGHRRAFSVQEYSPPLSIVHKWLLHFPALGVKISPGVDLKELVDYDCEVEFISLEGELKEATLWFGPLKTAARRATLLPGPHALTASTSCETLLSPPRAYLYEPDPAILRAGLVTTLGELLHAAQLDPDIAYLTSEQQTPTPFARVWAVEDWFPFNLKELRAYLRQHGIGRVTVKKRGSPLTPEGLIRDLRLSGDGEERTLFLTHLRGKPVVVVSHKIISQG